MDGLEALDFDDNATLCHVDGIFFHDLDDINLQAEGDDEFEDSWLVSFNPFSEVLCIIEARYELCGQGPFQRDHRDVGDLLEPTYFSIWQDFEVLDSIVPAQFHGYGCQWHPRALQWRGSIGGPSFNEQ